MTEERFEEWISHPNKRVFAPADDHFACASRQGWWATGWRGTATEVETRKLFYSSRPALREPEDRT